MSFKGVIATSVALVLLLAALTAGFAYTHLESATRARYWVDHTHRVIEQNQLVLTLFQRVENSERAYLISGAPEYLRTYATARNELPGAQSALSTMVSDNTGEVARVRALDGAIHSRLAELENAVDLARRGDFEAARAASAAPPPGPFGAGIRSRSDAVTISERALLESRVRNDSRVAMISLSIGLALATLSLLGLLGSIYYLARGNRRLVRAMRDADLANTSRAQAERRLFEAQRMEAVGQLTGGVAHDFNNLLQVIRGNLELLEPIVGQSKDGRRRLAAAIHGVERAAQLTRQLLAFARRQPLAAQVINLSNLICEMSELLRRTLGEGVEMETIIAPDLWNTLADPAQVESALLNLALNARDAMPAGGRLRIEVDNTTLSERDGGGVEGARAGEYVSIEVRDTGEGMTATTRERAFEPFFTTKTDGKGSGLGLSMVYGFVRQSGGFMQLESEPGQGSVVRIHLPRSPDPLTPSAVASPRTAEMADATILVVEDDGQVRAATAAMLRGLGYRCLETDSAEAALAVLETRPDVDLVFSDVIMPGALKTRDFAARVRELAPDTPILFTSGYTRDAIASHGRLDEGVALLPKPYARDELAARIGQLLAQAREAKTSALA